MGTSFSRIAEGGVPAQPLLRAYLFNRLHVEINDTVVSLPAGAQQTSLLASLLLSPDCTQPIDILIERLWPEEAEDVGAQDDDWDTRVRGRIHKLASNLRAWLQLSGAATDLKLIVAGGVVTLQPAPIWTDVAAFQQYYQAGQAASARGDRQTAQEAYVRAVELYTGDVLANEQDARWLFRLRDELQVKLLLMLRSLADWALFAGEPGSAVHWAVLGLRYDNAAEDLYQPLMRGLSRLGSRTLALRQYERCRAMLDALGIKPGEAIEQLVAALRRDEEI